MQSTIDLLYSRKSGEATGAGFLFFEGILTPVFLTCSIQTFKPGSEHGSWQSWSDSGIEMDGSSQGNMAKIVTGTPDVGRRTWKTSACFTFW